MFKIKKNQDMMNKTFRLPVMLLNELTRIADSNNVSVNNLVQQCCEYALSNMEKTANPEVNKK